MYLKKYKSNIYLTYIIFILFKYSIKMNDKITNWLDKFIIPAILGIIGITFIIWTMPYIDKVGLLTIQFLNRTFNLEIRSDSLAFFLGWLIGIITPYRIFIYVVENVRLKKK